MNRRNFLTTIGSAAAVVAGAGSLLPDEPGGLAALVPDLSPFANVTGQDAYEVVFRSYWDFGVSPRHLNNFKGVIGELSE